MSSEPWELVDAVTEVTDGSQQVHLDACQIRVMSNWSRLVSVARHYYRLRHLMGVIGWCLKENKKYARDELFDQFPEVDPKRIEREAKAERRKRSPHPKSNGKQASVVDKSRGRSSIKQRLQHFKRGTSTESGISEEIVVRSSKQVAVADSSVPSEVIASIENSHYM